MVLDTIAGGSYGECLWPQMTEIMENISRNNKAWSTGKSETGRNTFTIQATNNQAADEIHEQMVQMRTELGLVLKDVAREDENVNALKYLTIPPQPMEEYYYQEATFNICRSIKQSG